MASSSIQPALPRLIRPNFALLATICATLALIALAFTTGRYNISTADVITLLWSKLTGGAHSLPSATETVIWQLRAPRIFAAVLVGAALGAAGAAYQTLFRNPLVSPDILGVSSGASLGAVLAMFLALPVLAIQGFAFAGGLVAVGLIYAIAQWVRGRDNLLTLILAGVVVGTLLGSGIALIKTLADPHNQLPVITFWLLGSLAAVTPQDAGWAAAGILLPLIPLWLVRWRMDLLALPEDEARALGVNIRSLRALVIVCATLMTASAVAIAGVIGWIGLVVPHGARLLTGPRSANLLPLSALLGACVLLAVDTLARSLTDNELSPGVLTALLGTPCFIWLLWKAGHRA